MIELDSINKHSKEHGINLLYKQYGQFQWEYLKAKEDLRALWSLDIMAYVIYWPGAQGHPGFVNMLTNRGLAYEMYYCGDELSYDDLRSILPDLPEYFEELRPWETYRDYETIRASSPEYEKWRAWDAEGILNIKGWYWFRLHSGCWVRIHESIWQTFYELTLKYSDVWISSYWAYFARKAIADRERELEVYLSGIEHYGIKHECTTEDAREIALYGVAAWEECDQGYDGLLCKNGMAYFKLPQDYEYIQIPIAKRQEIRNDSLPGWKCIYCGLGHRLMIREEYFPRFRELTYGMGKNGLLYSIGFDVLHTILI